VKNLRNASKFLVILLGLILVIGIFFRCYNLEEKVYWHDEVYTSIRTAGYNGEEIVELVFNKKIINPKELLRYQVLSPEKTWQDTLDKLIEHPEHPPLYYLLSRGWQELFGSSIAMTRSLSVVFSLLLLPVAYWFCQELFDSPKVGLYAIGLIAISPVQVLYAQEAREYSLLVLTTAISCVALVGSVKRNNWQWWSFYGISLAANFYVSLIAAYIAIAQAAYIFVLEKFRLTKVTINFILAGIFSLVLFAPWLWVIQKNFYLLEDKTKWTNMTQPFIELFHAWERHLFSIFIDLHPNVNGYIASRIFGFLLIFILICYRAICFQTKPRTWLLIIFMTVIPTAMIIVPDLVEGQIKSIMTRYFLPSILMVQIVVAYWLSEIKVWQDLKRSIIMCLIILLGITSCGISARADTWWNKIVGYDNPKIAEAIDSYQKPLVISNNHDINVGNIISTVYLLKDNAKFLLFKNQDVPLVNSQNFSDILIWNITEESRNKFQIKNNCQLELVEGEYYPPLWRISS
jgi:uncharacterized membrane protein